MFRPVSYVKNASRIKDFRLSSRRLLSTMENCKKTVQNFHCIDSYNYSIIIAIDVIYLFSYEGAQPSPVPDLPSILGSNNPLTTENYLPSSDIQPIEFENFAWVEQTPLKCNCLTLSRSTVSLLIDSTGASCIQTKIVQLPREQTKLFRTFQWRKVSLSSDLLLLVHVSKSTVVDKTSLTMSVMCSWRVQENYFSSFFDFLLLISYTSVLLFYVPRIYSNEDMQNGVCTSTSNNECHFGATT